MPAIGPNSWRELDDPAPADGAGLRTPFKARIVRVLKGILTRAQCCQAGGQTHAEHLKTNNRRWAARKAADDPGFFRRLEGQQAPEYLWIGCSDSRVPANEIVDLDPGEMFVHRNVANLAPPQDANYLSVLQFAVDVLKVKHVLVVGHYGCGGVAAAVDGQRRGLVDHWLHPIREVASRAPR